MLENLIGTSKQEALQRIQSVRAPEPEVSEPTGDTVDNTPEEKAEAQTEEVETVETEAPETEELEAAEQPINDLEEVYDINGRELSLKQIKEWEDGSMMQSDYTRKTQALADDKKEFEAVKESVSTKEAKLNEQIAELESHLSTFESETFDGYTLEELRDSDPGQYLKITEQQKARKQALATAKESANTLTQSEKAERNKTIQNELIQNHPEWFSDGKVNEAYESDNKRVTDYMISKGFTEADQESIGSTKVWEALLDASKTGNSQTKVEALKKRVKKAPVVTKPGAGTQSVSQNEVQKARANHKKWGTQETAMALRKAQRKAAES